MDIGKSFVDSWNVYIKNFIVIIIALLVVGILGGVTFGIITIPLVVGFQMMFIKGKRGEAVSFNEIFAHFKSYWKLTFGALWIGVIAFLIMAPAIICYYFGWNAVGTVLMIAGVLGEIYIMVGWMFALLLIADKKLSINDAMKASRDLVTKNNWWMHFLLIILSGIVGQIGGIAWGIGALLTMPLGMGAVACAYAEEAK